MNTVDMWKILEIEPTKDQEAIVNAYRSKVVTVNPEDDAEGFMLLREAFEMAMKFATEDDVLEDGQEVSNENKTEVDLHIDKMNEIYRDVFKRRDIELWKEWLADPLCSELDTADAVREACLVSIMGHFMLPHEVWKLLDEAFNIVNDRDILVEKFPPDYLDYVTFQIQNDSFVDYKYFEPRSAFAEHYEKLLPEIKIEGVPGKLEPENYDVPIDSYVRGVSFLQGHVNAVFQFRYDMEAGEDDAKTEAEEGLKSEMDLFRSVLEYLESFDLWHPIELGARMRMLEFLDRLDEAAFIATAVLKDNLVEEHVYTRSIAAYMLLKYANEQGASLTEEDKAKYNELAASELARLEELKSESAMFRMAKSYKQLLDKEYEESSDTVISVLDENQKNYEAMVFLKEESRLTIEDYSKKAEEGTATPDQMMELCWSYFRTEDMDSVLKWIGTFEPTEEKSFSYCTLYARSYLAKERYEEAEPYSDEWLLRLEDLKKRDQAGEELTEREKGRLTRSAFCYYMYALCKDKLGREDVAEKYYSMAVEDAKKDNRDINERMFYEENYGKFLKERGRYQEAMDVWDDMIGAIDHCVPAYIHRQETAHELRNAQLVIDDYYNIIKDFPQYANAYVYAARVFCIYEQYSDAQSVFDKAAEYELKSDKLDAVKARMYERQGENEKAEKIYIQIAENIEKEESDIDDLVEFYADIASFYMNVRNEEGKRIKLDVSRDYMEKGIKLDPKNKRLLWIKTDLNEFSGESADPVYEEMLGLFPDDPQVYYEYGEYLKRSRRDSEAFKQYKKCHELDPQHRVVCNRMMEILVNRYNDNEDWDAYGEAVKYATKQLEIIDDDYYRIERALLYLDGYELGKAEEDARKAVEFKEDNTYANNAVGLCMLKTRRYKEALEWFGKAIEVMEEGETPTPFMNMAKTLECIGDFEKAIEYVNKCIEIFGNTLSRRQTLARLYTRARNFYEATKLYEEIDVYLKEQRANTNNRWYDVNIVKNYIRLIGLGHLAGNESEADRRRKQMNEFLATNRYDDLTVDVHVKGNLRKVHAEVYRALADYYLNDERNYKLSITYFEKCIRFHIEEGKESIINMKSKLVGLVRKPKNASKIAKPEDYVNERAPLRELGEMYRYFAGACYAYGLKEVAAELGERALECYRRGYGDVESYARFPQCAPLRISDLGMIYFFMGKAEEAFKYVETCSQIPPCDFCNYSECYDKILAQARMAELAGDTPKAIELYKLARRQSNQDVEIYMALRELAGVVED